MCSREIVGAASLWSWHVPLQSLVDQSVEVYFTEQRSSVARLCIPM
jgi:hypothetical protein